MACCAPVNVTLGGFCPPHPRRSIWVRTAYTEGPTQAHLLSQCSPPPGCTFLALTPPPLSARPPPIYSVTEGLSSQGPSRSDRRDGSPELASLRPQIRGCSLPRAVFRGAQVQGAVARFTPAGGGQDQSQAQAPSDAHQHVLRHRPVSPKGRQKCRVRELQTKRKDTLPPPAFKHSHQQPGQGL